MIYLMFNQPFLTGLMLFFGGLGSMFRKLVKKERKLKELTEAKFRDILTSKADKVQEIIKQERSKLFHFLEKNPLKIRKLTQKNLAKVAEDYFSKTYEKKG